MTMRDYYERKGNAIGKFQILLPGVALGAEIMVDT